MRHLSKKLAPAIMALSLVLGIISAFNVTAEAQRRIYRNNNRQIIQLIRRLEQNTDRFRNSLDSSLDRSNRDGTRMEDDINAFVRDFENATDQLRQRVDSRQDVAADVENLLQRAAVIDNFMGRRRAGAGAANEWAAVRNDLNTLASLYGVGWRWDNGSNYPIGGGVSNDGRRDGRFGRDWDRYENYGGSFNLRQTALNAGYNEGFKVGQNDRKRNRTSDYRSSSAYQKATSDYSSRLGDRELYRRYYRAGFENGYNDGYGVQVYGNQGQTWPNNNYPNDTNYPNDNQDRRGRNWDRYGSYGGSFQLRQTALNAGYNEGIKVGRADRNRGGASDFRSSSAYQDATKDYSSRLGDRELYRRYYREGFENGYSDGYNGY